MVMASDKDLLNDPPKMVHRLTVYASVPFF